MIRTFTAQFGSGFRIGLFQFGNLSPGFFVQFFGVHSFQYRFGSIILRKQVITEATLSFGLQSGTVSAESHQIILPSHIIHTFGVAFTASLYIKSLGCTGLDGIRSGAIGSYRSREYHLAVVRNLIRHLLPVGIQYHNLCRVCQTQTVCNSLHRHLYHFIRALHGQRIGYRNGYRLAVVTSEAKQSRHT